MIKDTEKSAFYEAKLIHIDGISVDKKSAAKYFKKVTDHRKVDAIDTSIFNFLRKCYRCQNQQERSCSLLQDVSRQWKRWDDVQVWKFFFQWKWSWTEQEKCCEIHQEISSLTQIRTNSKESSTISENQITRLKTK